MSTLTHSSTLPTFSSLQRPFLLPQPLALLYPEPVPEDHCDLLQAQSRRLREREHAEQPPEKAQPCIEPERTGWCDAIHEREVSGSDNQVPRPVRRRRE